jgi:ketosteroid isomerase-like protein
MKISELIEELEKAERAHGDVECLIEVMSDDVVTLLPVDELSFENREGYGDSISLLC